MEAFLWFVAATYLFTVVAWWYGLFFQRRLRIELQRLPIVTGWPDGQVAPTLAVVMACHNEEKDVEACLERLLNQDYPNLRVVIANDRSTDRTGELARRVAQRDPRVRVIDIDRLPLGWTGKTHALHCAATGCDADYYLFIDCDVELAPHAILTVMDKVQRDGLDFLSLWPNVDLRSFAERLLTPPIMFLLSMWAFPFSARRRDLGADTLLGNGQFLLVKRTSYEALGGHISVRDELAEDAILAVRAHAAGQRCWTAPGVGLYTTYREGGLSRTVHALARVIIGSLQTQTRILLGTQILAGGVVAPAWILPLALVLLACGIYPLVAAVFVVLSLLHMIAMTITLRRAFAMAMARRGSLFWFPLGAAIDIGILLWCSLLRAGVGSIRWAATRYRVQGSRVVLLAPETP